MVEKKQCVDMEYDTYIEKCFFEKLQEIDDRAYRENIRLSWLSDKTLYINLTKKIEFEFAHYSLHDSTHSVSILQYVQMILGKDIIDLFSVGDLWLLLEAAYSHDIGMAVNYDELVTIWKDKRNIKKIIQKIAQCSDKEAMDVYNYVYDCIEKDGCKRHVIKNNHEKEMFLENHVDWPLEFRRAVTLINSEYIRYNHPERSKNKINELIGQHEYMRIEERMYKIVGIIDHLHGTDFGDIEKYLDIVNTGFTTDKIHPRMIALLLRVGDVLDIRNNRFDYLNIKYLGHLPKDSQIHFYKHKSVNEFLVDQEHVRIRIDSSQFEVCSNSRAWLDLIDAEMNHLIQFWKIYSDDLPPLQLKKVDLKVTFNGSEFVKNDVIKSLKVNPKPLTELLSGENFYNTNLIVFREYLQNAIDATLLRLASQYYNDKDFLYNHGRESFKEVTIKDFVEDNILINYPIRIYIENDPKDNSLIVFKIVDQGTGMDSQGVDALFNIGKGWKSRDTFNDLKEDLPEWMYPTGGFGIGTLSAFLVCDNVKFITRARKSPQYTISIDSPDNGGMIEKIINTDSVDERIGTIVEFKINIATFLKEMFNTFKGLHLLNKPVTNDLDENKELNIWDLEYRLNIVGSYLKKFIDNFLIDSMFPVEINVMTKTKYISQISCNKLYESITDNYLLMDNVIVKYNEHFEKSDTRFAYKGILVTNYRNVYNGNSFLRYLCNNIISSVDIYDKDVKNILEISRNNFLTNYDIVKVLNAVLRQKRDQLICDFDYKIKNMEPIDKRSTELLCDLLLYFHNDLVDGNKKWFNSYAQNVSEQKRELYLSYDETIKYLWYKEVNSKIITKYDNLLQNINDNRNKPEQLIDDDVYDVMKGSIEDILHQYTLLEKQEQYKKIHNRKINNLIYDLRKLEKFSGVELFDVLKKGKRFKKIELPLKMVENKSLLQLELINKQKIFITTFQFLNDFEHCKSLFDFVWDNVFIVNNIKDINAYFLSDAEFIINYYTYQNHMFSIIDSNDTLSPVVLLSIEIMTEKTSTNKSLIKEIHDEGFKKNIAILENVDYEGYESIVLDPYPLELSQSVAAILNPFEKNENFGLFKNKNQIKLKLLQDENAQEVISFVYEYNKDKGVLISKIIDKYAELFYEVSQYNK